MNNEILIALMALVGTLAGTFGGIITSTKLTNFRLEQLENKVDVHNNFATEIPLLKQRIEYLENELEINKRTNFFNELEDMNKPKNLFKE